MAMQPTDSNGNALGTGCAMLFGLPFALVGIVMGGYIASLFYEAYAIRSWEPVPVRILSADVESHRGDDSTTYSLAARYTYTVDGRSYTNDRVYIDDSSDSFRSSHEKKAANLRARRDRGQTVTGYYDPDNPADAILYREPRLMIFALMLLFPGLFAPIGCGLMVGAFSAHTTERDQVRRKAHHPGEPWMWREDWARGEVEAGSTTMPAFWLLALFLWLVLTAPLFLFAAEYLLQGDLMSALPAAPYIIIDLVVVYLTLRSFGRARRYGMATLTLAQTPALRGAPLGITLRTEGELPHHDDLDVTVRCERIRTVKRGKNSSTTRDEEWSTQLSIPATEIARRGNASEVAFAIDLPSHTPDTSNEDSKNRVEWKLKAVCKTSGYDFHAEFELPVYGSRTIDEPAASMEAATVQAEPVHLDPKVVEVSETASGGLDFHFPRGRFLGASLVLFICVAVFGGATVAMVFADDVPTIMPYAFGGTTLILFLIILQMLTGSVRTVIEHGEMRIRRVVLFRPKRTRIKQGEVESITTKTGMQVNGRQFYDIIVKLKSGTRIKAGTSVPGCHQADQIAAIMSEALRS